MFFFSFLKQQETGPTITNISCICVLMSIKMIREHWHERTGEIDVGLVIFYSQRLLFLDA